MSSADIAESANIAETLTQFNYFITNVSKCIMNELRNTLFQIVYFFKIKFLESTFFYLCLIRFAGVLDFTNFGYSLHLNRKLGSFFQSNISFHQRNSISKTFTISIARSNLAVPILSTLAYNHTQDSH